MSSEKEKSDIMDLIGKDFSIDEVRNYETPVKKVHDFIEKEDEEKEDTGQWAVNGSTYWPCSDSVKELPPGIYSIEMTMGGSVFFAKHKVISDELIRLPDDSSERVLNHIEQFKGLKDKFREFGFIYKRGILLWGPQGSGKTCTVVQVMDSFIKSGGIAILGNHPGTDSAGLKAMREIESDKPIVVIYEDVDDVICYYGDRGLTKLLDGEDNVENVLFLATTNYPERLPPRLLNRPSRFDVVQHIGLPSEKARAAYLKAKTDLSLSEIQVWGKKTVGLSIPHIKELIILVKVYEKTLDEGIEIMKQMAKMTPNSSVYYGKEHSYNIELNVEQPPIEIEAPIIEVKASDVNIPAPNIQISVPTQQRMKKVVTKRDPQGRIEEAEDIPMEDENA